MYQVSDECRRALDSPGRITDFYCDVTFSDDSTRRIDSSVIKSNSVYRKTRCVSGSDFELGAVCVGEFGMSLLDDSLDSRNYEGVVVKPYCRVILSENAYEDIPMGKYNVTEISTPDHRTTKLVCYDDMAKFDKRFELPDISEESNIYYDMSLAMWLRGICTQCGVTLFEKSLEKDMANLGIDKIFGYNPDAPANADYLNCTCRDMLTLITQLFCACAVINRFGELEIINFDRRYSEQYPDYAMAISSVKRKSTNIKNIKSFDTVGVTLSDSFYNMSTIKYPPKSTSSNILMIDDTPFLRYTDYLDKLQPALKEIADRLQYLTYYGAETEIFSDPTIDAGDHLLLTGGSAGQGVRILVTKNDWTYRGSHKITSDVSAVQAKSINYTASSGGSSGGTTQYINNIAYGTCTTAASSAEKVISIADNPNWKLQTGSIVVVKFSYTNTAQNPKLNVNGTGAKSIWYNTALVTTSSLTTAGYANRYIKYFYDGTQFVWLGHSMDNNTTYSNASLGQIYGTCATVEATTAKTVAMSSYVLSTGGIVSIKFTNAVPAGSTLNISGKGAKSIYYKGSAITDGVIKAGDTATFIYSGQYHLIAIDKDVYTKTETDNIISETKRNISVSHTNDITAVYNSISEVKSNVALNRTTLGYQRKNQLNETGYLSSITSVTRGTKSISGNQITLTATAADCYTKPNADSDGGFRISVEAGTDYILSWESDNSNNGLVYVFMNGGTSSRKAANNNGVKSLRFTTNSDTTFITIRLGVANSGDSITYSNIMLRYADIADDTYEPYQPSVQEQTAYSISVSGKSTSSAISYSGVPTLICLTPNTADSTAGGLYMINSAGAVVKLIEKSGVVVAADSSSKTFTITNNTSTVMDVCVSRCWGR